MGRVDTAPVPWAELHCHSAYSFLDGASTPEELVAEAARLRIDTLAITDHDGMYAAAAFARAAARVTEETGVTVGTVFGAELGVGPPDRWGDGRPSGGRGHDARPPAAPRTGVPDPPGRHLLVLARDIEGYRRLCRVISAAHLAGGEKGRPRYDVDTLANAHDGHWVVVTGGCRKGAVPAALATAGPAAALTELERLVDLFGAENVMVELTFQGWPGDDERNETLAGLAAAVGVGVVATGNVHYATPARARVAEAMAAIRARRTLTDMDGWLPATGGAYLRSGAEMARRLRRFPGVLDRTVALGRACAFDFRLVTARLPGYPVPSGHTERSWLRALVAAQAPRRYGPPHAERVPGAHAQLDRELDIIERLGYSGYLLIVHDIVAFCARRGILCQGRGSAANSAVCYALGITSVDPVRHGLLFERFLSPGRDGPPDIDLDIEHRRREEVIRYVYARYSRDNAAQVADVITYRSRTALRDAGRVLGYPPDRVAAWGRRTGPGEPDLRTAGAPGEVMALARQLRGLPRHLGVHSGGMVLADRPVTEVCPVEWARTPGRSVLQWDKEDCAFAGLVKFDLLGLGMLSALHDCLDLVAAHHGHRWELASIPHDDPDVYAMLCRADTVGVFQVESRAQMSLLPRLRPRTFYDLVVAVALIRPGPIQGGAVHPYLRRRSGAEHPVIPHELMRGALARTLGVPVFQEQVMRLAVDCAGFSPAEADRLRAALSAKHAPQRLAELRRRLLAGMRDRGIPAPVAAAVYEQIAAFANYGFPESHAIGFASLVYASAWLKCHYPAAFTCAVLRNQPMGFYSPATLVGDARRRGVQVRGPDINASGELATLDGDACGGGQPAIRLGLRGVRNLGVDAAAAIVAGQPYTSLEDLARRVRLSAPALETLAAAGAFDSLGLSRREALWAAGAAAAIRPGQLPGVAVGLTAPPLPAATAAEETGAELWAAGASRHHPLVHLREWLTRRGVMTAAALRSVPHGRAVTVAGVVTHRQRPETARGTVFLNLEDETGMVDVVCPPRVWERHRRVGTAAPTLVVHGRVTSVDGAISVVAVRLGWFDGSRPVGCAARR